MKFTLEADNGDKLYFDGQMKKDLNGILGHYGVVEGRWDDAFTLLRKAVQVVEIWSGHYMQG